MAASVSSVWGGHRPQSLHGCLSLHSMARTDLEPRKPRFLGKPPSSLTNSCAPVSLLLRESQQLLRRTASLGAVIAETGWQLVYLKSSTLRATGGSGRLQQLLRLARNRAEVPAQGTLGTHARHPPSTARPAGPNSPLCPLYAVTTCWSRPIAAGCPTLLNDRKVQEPEVRGIRRRSASQRLRPFSPALPTHAGVHHAVAGSDDGVHPEGQLREVQRPRVIALL
jgi:hypothetical protein